MKINLASDITSFDPVRLIKQADILVGEQVFDKLIHLNDSTLWIEPEIARLYEISPDGKTYTFHLRNDVYFQDDECFANGKGRCVVAEDIRYSLTRVVDAREKTLVQNFLPTMWRGARDFYDETIKANASKQEPRIASVKGYIVKDDSTFIIKLTKPAAPFIYHIATPFGYIVPKEAIAMYGQKFSRKPIGSGAFRFASWDEERSIVLERNPKYWMKDAYGNSLPYLQGIQYSFIKESSSQFLSFRKGELHENVGIPREFVSQVFDENGKIKPEFSEKYIYKSTPELRIDFIGMLTTDELFKNKKLRLAIAHAIDKEKLVKYVLKEQVTVGKGIVPSGFALYDNRSIQSLPYDVSKAKTLLADAGYPNGKGLPKITLNTFIGTKYAFNKETAEVVQAMLKEIGLDVQIIQMEYSTHYQQAILGKLSFFLGSWGADYPDPYTFLCLLDGTVIPKDTEGESYLNLVRYKNEAYDKLMKQSLLEQNQSKRYELYVKAEQLALDDAPMIISYNKKLDFLLAKNVRNYTTNSMDRRVYRRLWLD